MVKPTLQLSGKDGNAFVILGAAKQGARRAKWTKKEWEKFKKEAMNGDYDQLLQTCWKYFVVE